jgi:hypothetical protein
MKPILLAAGLFLALLLARSTFTMSAQAIRERPRPVKVSAADTRARRSAALEAQDQNLAMRQREIELELGRIAEAQHKVQNQLERLAADPHSAEPECGLQDLLATRTQLLQKKAEMRQELEGVVADRQRVQEDWLALTGLRVASR